MSSLWSIQGAQENNHIESLVDTGCAKNNLVESLVGPDTKSSRVLARYRVRQKKQHSSCSGQCGPENVSDFYFLTFFLFSLSSDFIALIFLWLYNCIDDLLEL